MDLSSITREQKLFAAAGASALWVISLFFPWYDLGLDIPDAAAQLAGVDETISGWDVVPSAWLFLVIGVVAALAAVSEAMDYELPMGLPGVPLAAWATSILAVVTIAIAIDGDGGRAWGIFLAVIFSVVAVAASAWVWREER